VFGQGYPLAVVGWKVQTRFRADPSLNLEEEDVRRQGHSGRVWRFGVASSHAFRGRFAGDETGRSRCAAGHAREQTFHEL